MATYNKNTALTKTLVAATADTVTFTDTGAVIQLTHHATTTDPIYFTIGGGSDATNAAAAGATPTSEGDDCRVLLSGTSINVAYPTAAVAAIKLISAGAVKYSIQVLAGRLI